MKISDRVYKKTLISLSVVFMALAIFSWASDDFSVQAFVLSFGLAGTAYLFSDKFKTNNAIDKLVVRKNNSIYVSNAVRRPLMIKGEPKAIDISRISLVTIGDDMMAIIIDGNGNGYDFQLNGSREVICSHLISLISATELEKIKVQFI